MSTSSSDGKRRGGGVADLFQRALESRPVAAARGTRGERVDVPTCANCGAPREAADHEARAASVPATCRYCGERL